MSKSTYRKRGRPPGVPNIGTIVRRVAAELVTIETADGPRGVTVAEAVLRKVQLLSLTGNLQASRLLDRERERHAPAGDEPAGLLVTPEPPTMEEWVREQEIRNRFRTPPDDPRPGAASTPAPAPPSTSPLPPGAGQKRLPSHPGFPHGPRLIR